MKGYYDAEYILDGLKYGFHIGVDPTLDNIDNKLCNQTMYINLTEKEKNAITEWFLKGTQKGYICGPFDVDFSFAFGKLHISPLFVVPKPLKD